MRDKQMLVWVCAGGFLLMVAVGSLSFGAVRITPAEVFASLFGKTDGEGVGIRDVREIVLYNIRLPRLVAAACVGAALGAAGCLLQALLRNPLASPFVIGASSAGGFGAVVAIFLGAPFMIMLLSAFAMSSASGFAVLALARTRGRLPTESVVLAGFGIGLLFSALTGLVQYLAREEWQLREMVLWLMGGLWRVTWEPLTFVAPAVFLTVIVCWSFTRDLDILSIGEFDALRLGVNVGRFHVMILLLACLLTSLAVSIGGVIAFVGLVVPHIARKIVGVTHGRLFPASVLIGAALVIVADTAARTVVLPNELPLGVVTSLIGVPFFFVIFRSVKRKTSFL